MTRLLPYGERAVLVDLPDLDAVHALAAGVARARDARVADVVPAARTVLVVVTEPVHLDGVTELVSALIAGVESVPAEPDGVPQAVRIPVRYDGQDLDDVATATGLSRAEVVQRHTRARYRVDFVGFLPGFAYLGGLDPRLHLPRLASPRPRVPAGSVAIAGPYTAVYPRESPGGWLLLGRTSTTLFALDADPPARLRAGMHVRFEATAS